MMIRVRGRARDARELKKVGYHAAVQRSLAVDVIK
jgi:hypothetical protein